MTNKASFFLFTVWRCDNCGASIGSTKNHCSGGCYPVAVSDYNFEAAEEAGFTFTKEGNYNQL